MYALVWSGQVWVNDSEVLEHEGVHGDKIDPGDHYFVPWPYTYQKKSMMYDQVRIRHHALSNFRDDHEMMDLSRLGCGSFKLPLAKNCPNHLYCIRFGYL